MRPPFPGMDPYLESQEWDDFDTRLIVALGEQLDARVSPEYIVRAERRVYIEHLSEPPFIVPDLLWPLDAGLRSSRALVAPQRRSALSLWSASCRCRCESYLVIRERHGTDVVTVIEILLPTNKRRGSSGSAEYLSKREAVLASQAHLVELDLLRGGQRPPLGIHGTSD